MTIILGGSDNDNDRQNGIGTELLGQFYQMNAFRGCNSFAY